MPFSTLNLPSAGVSVTVLLLVDGQGVKSTGLSVDFSAPHGAPGGEFIWVDHDTDALDAADREPLLACKRLHEPFPVGLLKPGGAEPEVSGVVIGPEPGDADLKREHGIDPLRVSSETMGSGGPSCQENPTRSWPLDPTGLSRCEVAVRQVQVEWYGDVISLAILEDGRGLGRAELSAREAVHPATLLAPNGMAE